MHPGSPTSFESGPAAASDPRRLILTAMIHVAGTKGYREASVADVLAEAGVSRSTFHRHFAGLHDCFLAACETALDGLRDEVFAGCDANAAWAARMRTALAAILDRFAADPALARVATIEPAVAGSVALRLYFDTVGRFGEFVHSGRDDDRELPDEIALMAVGGVAGLIADEVAAGRAERLRQLLPSLLYALLLPYVGPEAATTEMRLATGPY